MARRLPVVRRSVRLGGGNWSSPFNLSTHNEQNAGFTSGIAVVSLTADNATGNPGTPPVDNSAGGSGGLGGSSGSRGMSKIESGGTPGYGGAAGSGGASSAGGGTTASSGTTPSGGVTTSGGTTSSSASTTGGSSGGSATGSHSGCNYVGADPPRTLGAALLVLLVVIPISRLDAKRSDVHFWI